MSRHPLVIALALPALASPALAQNAPLPAPTLLAMHDALRPRMETMVVTGSRDATRLTDTPLAISQIARDEIDSRHAAFTGEVLNKVPGLYMSDLGNEQHSMSIRQPITTNALYLYLEDGIPIRPLGLFNHNALYEINLESSGSIEVIKGPASSLYGANSVGGTVNFITRAPSASPTAAFGAQGSDQGYWRTQVDLSGTEGDLGGRFSGYLSRRSGGWQDYNDAEKASFSGRADWQATPSTLVKGVISYSHLYTDMPGSLFENDYKQRPGFSYNRFTYREVDASRASLSVDGDWLSRGNSVITVYARDNSTEQLPSYLIFATGNPAISAGRLNDNDFKSLGVDARQTLNFDLADSRLVFGLTVDRTDNTYTEETLTINRDPLTGAYLSYAVVANRRDYEVDLGNEALYAQFEFAPLDAVRVVAGARYDAIEYDYINNRVPSSTTGAPSEKRDFSHLSPRLGATWTPHPDHTLYVNVSEGFLPPEISALYGRLEAPNLTESIFTNREVGWRGIFLHGHLALDAALYRLDGDDEVVNFTIAPGNSEPRNAGSTRHQGIELGAVWQFNEQWQLTVASAWSEHDYRRYRVSPTLDYSGKRMPAAPEWIANTELQWQVTALPGLTLALEWVHLGNYWMNNANTVRYDGHDLANLRASYQRGRWEWWLKGQNLGDVHYAETASSSFSGSGSYNPNAQNSYTPGAPRTASIGFNYRYGGK
jgi:outer membrane receptor protein involved in Fe transport